MRPLPALYKAATAASAPGKWVVPLCWSSSSTSSSAVGYINTMRSEPHSEEEGRVLPVQPQPQPPPRRTQRTYHDTKLIQYESIVSVHQIGNAIVNSKRGHSRRSVDTTKTHANSHSQGSLQNTLVVQTSARYCTTNSEVRLSYSVTKNGKEEQGPTLSLSSLRVSRNEVPEFGDR